MRSLDAAPPADPPLPCPSPRGLRWTVLACAVGALVSLVVLPSAPLHDQWAWLVWGREVAQGDLDLSSGPAWKPLPVMVAAALSPFGEAAPDLWLAVARLGGLLALAVAFRLGARIAGWPAGVLAVLLLLSAWLTHVSLGIAEGLLVALLLCAVDRHLDGRPGQALVLGFAASLIRPEAWPLLALYAAFLFARERRLRAVAPVLLVLAPILWLAPDLLSGEAMRSSDEAQGAAATVPGAGEVLRRAYELVPLPVHLAALGALALAARRRAWAPLALGGIAASWVAIEVALAVLGGYQGVTRFLYPVLAFEAVLAAVGVVWALELGADRLSAAAPRRVLAPGPLLAAGAFALVTVPLAGWRLERMAGELAPVTERASFYRQLDDAVARAGGPDRLRACGRLYASKAQAPAVAWRLGVHIARVEPRPHMPGAVLRVSPSHRARIESDVLPVQVVSLGGARFPRAAAAGPWEIRASCSDLARRG